jgi:hypothetical protein
MGKPQGVLTIVAVTDEFVIGEKHSSVVVRLLDPRKNAVPDIQTKYDLASLGEVESIIGPYDDPLTWMVRYKGEVSAKKGAVIKLKE